MESDKSYARLLTVDDIRNALNGWIDGKDIKNVNFSETLEPDNSDPGDIQTIYEAVFEPSSLNRAWIEIWMLPDAEIHIGFEQYARLKKRLGVWTWRHGYIDYQWAGHLSKEALTALLDEISLGNLMVIARTYWRGLGKVQAAITDEVRDRLTARGYHNSRWQSGLKVLPSDHGSIDHFSILGRTRIVRYGPW